METKEDLEKWYATPDPWKTENSVEDRVRSDILLQYVRYGQFKHALDIGCGEGALTARLAPFVEKTDGFDLSETAVGRAKARGIANANFFAMDMRDVDMLESRYDLVLCSEVLYYLTEDADRRAMFAKIRKVMQPTGVFLLSVIIVGQTDWRRYFTYEEGLSLLREHFRVVTAMPNAVRRDARTSTTEKALRAIGRIIPSMQQNIRHYVTVSTPPENAYQLTYVAIPR
ncbi:class I SAM-dependent DNA methyltransferase [Marinivivus vitaminiproducens]|uniref:class I SAM-dependent DNA methyltransferase n=1 Tax=Marinivivus vitaminiproducens TaxID=3035935 RepID=UPI00279C5806|nr:class I SAM-dependent methyltransferase [Geminicoccaceae bacterium SCSIO 64248]